MLLLDSTILRREGNLDTLLELLRRILVSDSLLQRQMQVRLEINSEGTCADHLNHRWNIFLQP
jgi:hypothetical protein